MALYTRPEPAMLKALIYNNRPEIFMKMTSIPRLILLAALASFAAGCAGTSPFLSPEDAALRQKVKAEVAQYSHVIDVSVVDGRVYLTSDTCVDSYGLTNKLEEEIERIDGVTKVFSHVPVCGDDRLDRLSE